MATRIVNVDPTRQPRTIADTGQTAAFGEEIEIEDAELAERLLEQSEVWARPTSKAAKTAEKGS